MRPEHDLYSLEFGVPQGSTLGSLLFLLYVNDVLNVLSNENIIMFADDTTIIVSETVKKPWNSEPTQYFSTIKHIQLLCINKLSVNINKTKYVYFPPNNRNAKTFEGKISNKSMSGIEIEEVSEYKFLGIIIDSKLNWQKYKHYISKKIVRNIGVLYKNRHILSLENMIG